MTSVWSYHRLSVPESPTPLLSTSQASLCCSTNCLMCRRQVDCSVLTHFALAPTGKLGGRPTGRTMSTVKQRFPIVTTVACQCVAKMAVVSVVSNRIKYGVEDGKWTFNPLTTRILTYRLLSATPTEPMARHIRKEGRSVMWLVLGSGPLPSGMLCLLFFFFFLREQELSAG